MSGRWWQKRPFLDTEAHRKTRKNVRALPCIRNRLGEGYNFALTNGNKVGVGGDKNAVELRAFKAVVKAEGVGAGGDGPFAGVVIEIPTPLITQQVSAV